MDLRDRLALRFTKTLVSTPRGRAHVLNQVAFAEGSDEGRVFSRLRARVGDDALAKMIEKHEADEVRHAALFTERLRATGIDPGPVPMQLRHLDRIDRRLGRDGGTFFERPIESDRDVMETYLVLQVIEERALHQFPLLEAAFRSAGDVETAAVFAEVARDEERHLKYCHAIAKRYSPSDALHANTLATFRLIEAEAFRDNSNANMAYVLEHVVERSLEKTLWELFARSSARSMMLPFTRFSREAFDRAA